MPSLTGVVRGFGLAIAGVVVAGGLSLAPAQAMPIQTSSAMVAADIATPQTVQYRDWDRGRGRWERRRDDRRWDRGRDWRRWERHRRQRDWQRRNYY